MPNCSRCQETVAANAERCPKCGAWISPGESVSESVQVDWENEVRRLANHGRKLEAIKLFREQTHVGLAEAKAAVEALEAGQQISDSPPPADDFERRILALMTAGEKIAAIKLYRDKTNSGLKEAKEAVEALAARHGISTPTRTGCLGVLLLLAVCGLVLVLRH